MKIVLKAQAKQNKRKGILLGVLGILCLLGGLTALFYHPAPPAPPAGLSGPAEANECLASWRSLGLFQVTQSGQTIVIQTSLQQASPRELLTAASLGIALCHNYYRVQFFCMGLSCRQPGLTLQLVHRP